MYEMAGEYTAHLAGFSVSVGNWIAPNGNLISGTNDDDDHAATLARYLNVQEEQNHLRWMNEKVENEGFVRLVFRNEVWLQVNCKHNEELWSDKPNFKRLMKILTKLTNIEVHIFSTNVNIIGKAQDVVKQRLESCQVK